MIPVSHFRNTVLQYVTSCGLKVVLDCKASFENGHPPSKPRNLHTILLDETKIGLLSHFSSLVSLNKYYNIPEYRFTHVSWNSISCEDVASAGVCAVVFLKCSLKCLGLATPPWQLCH